mgnify:CR=1 FL=1
MTMKNRVCSAIMALFIFYAMAANAMAADYSFTTDAPQDYYGDTSYEDIYGSQYNYGGPNVVDFQIPELEYGILSTITSVAKDRKAPSGGKSRTREADDAAIFA